MDRKASLRPASALTAAFVLAALGFLEPARADVSTEARTPAEIYERKSHVAQCVRYVARDLDARWRADPAQPPARLLLLVDATTTLRDEIAVLREALPDVWREGPPGLRVGVRGVLAGDWKEPSRIPTEADGRLAALAFFPVDGPRNLLAAVRDVAGRLADGGGGPTSLLLVSQAYEGAEDDVEATREILMTAGVAFYCVAGEAGFERAWLQEFKARDHPARGLTERYNPLPRRRDEGSLYYGSDVAFGLVPYRWEGNLAQSDFVWIRPPRYPVPSGFGYWSLATLCYATGGRYFVYDFTLPADHPQRIEPRDPTAKKSWHERRRRTTYDYSRLSLLAPDLRPRRKILKSLDKDWRAQTIVRIWEHLANDARPIVQRLGALERRGTSLVPRPERPVRSQSRPPGWLGNLDDVRKAKGFVHERIRAVDAALSWWAAANGRERTAKPGSDPLLERIEADFQLLGVQLRKVRFHLGEMLAALESIKPLDITYRRVRILPKVISRGAAVSPEKVDLGDDERTARWAEVVLAQSRLARRHADTPWATILEKGRLMTFRKDVQILEDEAERRRRSRERRERREGRDGKKDGGDAPTKPAPAPAPAPAPGPRPGSGGGGPVTGK